MTIDIDTLLPMHRNAFAYWQQLAGKGTSPLRSDFDPFAIPYVLPHVIMTNVVDRGRDFQFRVFGQAVLDRLNNNYTGMFLSELPDQEKRQKVWQSYRAVTETGRPSRSALEYTGPYENISVAEELYLPFFQTGGDICSILVVVAFDNSGKPPSRRY